jgi:hypothetical protein
VFDSSDIRIRSSCGLLEDTSVRLSLKSKDPDSSVDVATGYGLEGKDSIHGRGNVFLYCTDSRLAPEPNQFSIQ